MPGIVVGLDGSPNSERALDWSLRHAAALHSSLTAVAVHQVTKSYWGHEPVVGAGDVAAVDQLQRSAEEMTQRALSRLTEGKPSSVQVRAVNGFVVEELVNASHDADELVLGSRSTTGLTRLVMGSISSEVMQHSACPVVIVPHHR